MKHSKYFLLFLTISLIGCGSGRIDFETLKKREIKAYKKSSKENYKRQKQTWNAWGNTYKDLYNEYYGELEQSLDVKQKVLDSLNVYCKDFTIIQLYSTNYSGIYESTFILYEDNCVHYYIRPNASPNEIKNLEVDELTLDSIRLSDSEIIDIRNYFKNNGRGKINLPLNNNPIMSYTVTVSKNKKLEFYKFNSQNNIVEDW